MNQKDKFDEKEFEKEISSSNNNLSVKESKQQKLSVTEEEKKEQQKKKLTPEQKKELNKFILKGLLIISVIGIVLIAGAVLVSLI